jgi:Flp pilus assembly protein TadB
MVALTSIIAIAAVAAAVGGTISAKRTAGKQAKAAKKQSRRAAAAATAKRPSETTDAEVRIAQTEKDRKRGKGSQAARDKAASLAGPSASSVGGL